MQIPRWSPGVTLAQIDAMPREILDRARRFAEAKRAQDMERLFRIAQVAQEGLVAGETPRQRRHRRLGY